MYFDRKRLGTVAIIMIVGLIAMFYVILYSPFVIDKNVVMDAIPYFIVLISPAAVYSIYIRLFIWDKGLDVQGNKLFLVTDYKRHSVSIGDIINFKVNYFAEKKFSLTIYTSYGKYTIYPKNLLGGFDACKKYLEDIGIPEKTT